MSSRQQTISSGQPGYPHRLNGVHGMPEHLHVRGQLCDAERVVAIVGSRAAHTDEMAFARDLAAALAERGTQVISGGALGIDSAAHRGALDSGHPVATVAVLGCGLDAGYPERNLALFDEICERGGALVSQFDDDAPPRSWYFVRRNATMAAMADAVIVVGAGAQSGALHTARFARKAGRVVCARPGRAGCDALIAQGAAVVRGVADVDDALAGQPARPQIDLPGHDSPAGKVLAYLDGGQARDVDDIARGTGLMVREVSRALTSLELDGLALPLPGRSYVRSTLAQTLLVR